MHLQNLLKTSLVGSERMGVFWVTDTLACLGTIPVSIQEKLSALRSAMGNDGVHFSAQGRYNLFTNLAKTIYGLLERYHRQTDKAEAVASVVFRQEVLLERIPLGARFISEASQQEGRRCRLWQRPR